jgi:hypothetical protein
LKEWSSLNGDGTDTDDADPGSANDGAKPMDAMSSIEKLKAQRDAKKKQQDQVRTADLDLKSTQRQQDYYVQQGKKNKLDIQAKQKQLQALKGATPASAAIPAGGTVA